MLAKIKTLLLDRDGVINRESTDYVKSPDEWQPLSGSLEAIALLSKRGIKIGVATNQRGLALGLYDLATLKDIHQKMLSSVTEYGGRIDAIRYCPHNPNQGCECRKPKPKMLLQLLEQLSGDAATSCMIGDKYADIEAARAAGVIPILVLTGYGQQAASKYRSELNDTAIFPDLAAAALAINQCVA